MSERSVGDACANGFAFGLCAAALLIWFAMTYEVAGPVCQSGGYSSWTYRFFFVPSCVTYNVDGSYAKEANVFNVGRELPGRQ